jgi:hypothetical protein
MLLTPRNFAWNELLLQPTHIPNPTKSTCFLIVIIFISNYFISPEWHQASRDILQKDDPSERQALSGLTAGRRRPSVGCTIVITSTIRHPSLHDQAGDKMNCYCFHEHKHYHACSGVIRWERLKLARHSILVWWNGSQHMTMTITMTEIQWHRIKVMNDMKRNKFTYSYEHNKYICTNMHTSKIKAPSPVGIHAGKNDIYPCFIMLRKIMNWILVLPAVASSVYYIIYIYMLHGIVM